MDIKFSLVFLLSVLFYSCGGQRDTNISSESTALPQGQGLIQSTEHYLAYLPADLESDQAAPMLLIFDPQGNPGAIMEHLKPLAGSMGWRMAGALKSRNGNDETPQVVNDFLQEVQRDFPVENSYLVACGFSGGARVAEYTALSYPDVSALIMSGAGPSATETFAEQNIITTIIAGTRDFNFYEAYAADNSSRHPDKVLFLYHDGKHVWPETTLLKTAIYRTALAWNINPEEGRFNADMAEIAAEIKIRYLNHPWLKMEWDNFYAAVTGNENKTEDPALKNRLQALLTSEQALRQQYANALTQNDRVWWERELKALAFKKNAEPAGLKKDMYHRLSGFLGIASFSLANSYLQQNQWQKLRHVLEVYQMLEPDNPDMFYFKARLFQEQNNPDSATFFAKKAWNSGYQDTAKLRMEFNVL